MRAAARQSENLWPYLTGQTDVSPRTEVFANPGVLISDGWKIIGANEHNATEGPGIDVPIACWAGPRYPNGSTSAYSVMSPAIRNPIYSCNRTESCAETGGCLYHVLSDPEEHINLAATQPEKLQEMKERLSVLQRGIFNPMRFGGDMDLPARFARERWGGFWGPFIFP